MLRVLIAVFLLVIASSCFEEGDCLITSSHFVKVSLLASKDKKTVSIAFDSVYIPGYSPVYKDTTLNALHLPVDPALTQMRWVMRYKGKVDTLGVAYDNFVVVPSPTCGAFPHQRNLVLTESTFPQDSVVITERSLLKDVTENARIYF